MAKIVKMGKVQAEAMVAYGVPAGIQWSPEGITPNSYGCVGCGLVWSRKWQASSCEERSHVRAFAQHYGGYMLNGVHVGGKTYTRTALSRDEAICE